jgi:hypothetical protein
MKTIIKIKHSVFSNLLVVFALSLTLLFSVDTRATALENLKNVMKMVQNEQYASKVYRHKYNLMLTQINEYCKDKTTDDTCTIPARTLSYKLTDELYETIREQMISSGYYNNSELIGLLFWLRVGAGATEPAEIKVQKINHSLAHLGGANNNYDYIITFTTDDSFERKIYGTTTIRYDKEGNNFHSKSIIYDKNRTLFGKIPKYTTIISWKKLDGIDTVYFHHKGFDPDSFLDRTVVARINPGKLATTNHAKKNLATVMYNYRLPGKSYYSMYSTFRADKNGGSVKTNYVFVGSDGSKEKHIEKENFDNDGESINLAQQNEDGSWTMDIDFGEYDFQEEDTKDPDFVVKTEDLSSDTGVALDANKDYRIIAVTKNKDVNNLVHIQGVGNIVDKNMDEELDADDVILEYNGSKLHFADANSITDNDNLDFYYMDEDDKAVKLSGIWLEKTVK